MKTFLELSGIFKHFSFSEVHGKLEDSFYIVERGVHQIDLFPQPFQLSFQV